MEIPSQTNKHQTKEKEKISHFVSSSFWKKLLLFPSKLYSKKCAAGDLKKFITKVYLYSAQKSHKRLRGKKRSESPEGVRHPGNNLSTFLVTSENFKWNELSNSVGQDPIRSHALVIVFL